MERLLGDDTRNDASPIAFSTDGALRIDIIPTLHGPH
jgi:hypothetical protein